MPRESSAAPLAGGADARESDLLGSLIDPDNTDAIVSAQARRIANRFGLPYPYARVVARHAFGECAA
ncbi:hypothetical protein RUR49_06830 [Pseudoxanthobacter sp. M-2]|uniref:hypothetical protein n=1 Tax=Pseudoxanthobacter sp. M-2 TaxID=3078754 RepID=UPI0038FC9966